MTPAERLERKNAFDASLVIGSRRFNLATGRQAHLARREEVKRTFVDPATQSLKPGLGMSRACPVCSTNDAAEIFVKDGFRHLRCARCTMIYVNPVLTQDRLHAFYLDETSYAAVLVNETQRALDELRFAYALDVLHEHLDRPGRLLDVGCGPGTFLKVARDRAWTVYGVEFNKTYIRLLAEADINIVDVPLEEAQLEPGSFQCVTLWDVLEHISEPRPFLDSVRPLLSADGVLMIEVPQVDSLVSRLLHEKSATFAGDSHVNLFNITTLTRLLEDAGFVVKEAETLLTEIGAISNHLSFEDPYFGEGSFVLDCLTPKYIHDHLLGARLFALAGVAVP